jgi:RNA polymerase sigma factor (sigma-70 family)
MDSFSPQSRLDAITTRWTIMRQAHAGQATSAVDARRVLVLRYAPAIKSYVRAMTRDENEADELAQDAVVRLLQGDFAGADPDRGRFRDLLKTAVRNMVRNHWDKQKRRKPVDFDASLLADDSESDSDRWTEDWRRRVLELAWDALRHDEQENPQSSAYTILRLRTDHPDATSDELAGLLSKQLGRPVRADAFRQQLRRARLRFAECLVDEVADGMANPTAEKVEEELVGLGIWDQVRPILPEEWKRT